MAIRTSFMTAMGVTLIATLISASRAEDEVKSRRPIPTPASVGWVNMPWKFRGPWLPEGHRFNLIRSASVQEDLGLAEDQKEKITVGRLPALSDDIDRLRSNIVRKWAAPHDKDLREAGLIRLNILERILDRELAGTLTLDQKRRLDEIALQQAGPLVLAKPEMMQRLGLSEPQTERLLLTLAESKEKLNAELIEKAGPSPGYPSNVADPLSDEEKAQLQALSDRGKIVAGLNHQSETETDRALAGILTRAQKDRFERMLGKPFDLSRLTHDFVIQQAQR